MWRRRCNETHWQIDPNSREHYLYSFVFLCVYIMPQLSSEYGKNVITYKYWSVDLRWKFWHSELPVVFPAKIRRGSQSKNVLRDLKYAENVVLINKRNCCQKNLENWKNSPRSPFYLVWSRSLSNLRTVF